MDTNTKTRHLLCVCQWHVDPVIVSCVGISGGLEIVPSLTACCSGRREAAGNPVSHCNFGVKTDRVLAVCRPPAASASVLQRARRTYACDIFWGMDSHITAKIIYDYHSKIMQNSVIWSGALPRYLITSLYSCMKVAAARRLPNQRGHCFTQPPRKAEACSCTVLT